MSQLQIQDARAVAYRALCMGALLKRGKLEVSAQDGLKNADTKYHIALNQWLIDENILQYLSETEQFLLAKPLGTWSDRTLTMVGWRTEALGVMLWSLNRLDTLPSYDTQFETHDILEPLDIANPTIDFIWLANLRSDYDLRQGRDQAELWNWRSRARELQRMGVRPPEGVSFNEIIRFTTERAHRNGHIPNPIQDDFPVFNKPYAYLNPDEYALLSSIAYERYSALSWICEISSEWESIHID
ncbi:MAG: hypothetical protein Phog2KO_24200 [Phototrophicaceae bacterium]